jgi:hypothetical protein
MKIPSIEGLNNDVDRSQLAQSVMKQHSVGSINLVAPASGFPSIDQKRVISKSLLDN